MAEILIRRAPPINPDRPPFGGSQIPPELPPTAPSLAPANGAAQEVAPPQAAPTAPDTSPSPVVATSVAATDSYVPPGLPVTAPTQFIAPTPLPAPTQIQVPAAQATSEPATVAAPLVAAANEAPPIQPSAGSGATLNSNQPVPETGDAPARAMVEIMTLSHEADADAMVAALRRHGYSVAVNRDPHDSLLHLDVGPFASKADAETMRQRLLGDGYDATINEVGKNGFCFPRFETTARAKRK